jgi:four helix bundle protein
MENNGGGRSEKPGTLPVDVSVVNVNVNDSTGPGSFTGTLGGTGTGTGTPVLMDHEKLEVFQVTSQFLDMLEPWLKRKMPAELHKQLESSSMSILSNIAEGAGKTARADKRRFYEMARGSATESAAHLHLLRIKQVVTRPEYDQGRNLVVRIVQMLSRMAGPPRTT